MSPRGVLAVTGLAALLLAPGLISGPSLDPAVFLAVGERLADGHGLYAGAWDHKPPGIYLLNFGAQLLPWPSSWLAVWLMSLLATSGTAWLLGLTLRRLGVGAGAALLASLAAVAVMAQYLMALGGGLTEPIASLPAAAAVYAAFADRPSGRRFAAIGLLLGSAVLISLQLLVGAAMVSVLAVHRAGVGRRLMASAAVLGGAALPIALAIGWLAASGTLGAAVEAVLGYAAAYRAANAPSGGDLSASVASWTLLAWAFLLLPAGFGVIRGLWAGSASRQLILLSGAWVLLSLVAFAVQGRFIAHYAIPLAIPMGLLAGIGFQRAGARGSRARLVLASWGPLIVLSAVAGIAGGLMEWRAVAEGEGRAAAVAAELRGATAPEATLLVWGNEPRLYLQSGLRQATPYSYLYPLTTRGYASEELIDELARALRAAPPDAVVDAGSAGPGQPGFLPLLIPRPVATDGRDLDLLDPLRAFVEERYLPLSTVDGWVIYVRR